MDDPEVTSAMRTGYGTHEQPGTPIEGMYRVLITGAVLVAVDAEHNCCTTDEVESHVKDVAERMGLQGGLVNIEVGQPEKM